MNFLLSEDEGVLEMINEVANFTLTSYPGENIRTALKSLADGLRDRSLKVQYIYTACIHGNFRWIKISPSPASYLCIIEIFGEINFLPVQ